MGSWTPGSKVTFLDEDEEALLSSKVVLRAGVWYSAAVYMGDNLAKLEVLAGIAGFGCPDPMAPYLLLGGSKSIVLPSSRPRVLKPAHGDPHR